LRLQSYLAVNAVTTLIVASVVEEAKRSATGLRLARDEMEERVIERTALLSTANDALRVEIAERRIAEERFRRLLESAPDAMVIVNVDGKMEIVNSQTETMFGYTRSALIGQPVEILVPERKRAQHRFERMRSIGARAMPGLDLVGVRRDGTKFPLEITLSPIAMGEQTVLCAAIRDKTEQKALEARLMAAERERGDNLRAFAASVQGAQEEERQRVSRELHDDLGQRLAALKLKMQMFEQELSGNLPPRTTRIDNIVGDVDRMITEVRRLSYNLRPLALDDYGLSVALEMLCKEFEKVYNVTVRLQVDGAAGELHDEQLDIALYRIAQGALSNVAKHAAATNVDILMTRNDHTVVLSVEDDGRGFDMASLHQRRDIYSGLGLIGMRERSEILGGSFAIASKPEHGTRIQVQIPITGSPHESRRQENTNSDR
jgi:PAS domain S-box-containing protein